jgi:hypothetical protein
MDFQLILKLLTDYGSTFLIVGIFFYVIIKFISIKFERYRTRLANKNHDELIDIRNNIGKSIQTLIENYLNECEGNRVHVIEFSNSVTSVAYLPFRYMTCTYEVFRIGKSATGHKIDRISTSLFTPFFEALYSHEYCIFDITDKTTIVGGAMCDLMRSQDEHRALCSMMKTPRGKAIGYVFLTKDSEFTGSDIDGMISLSDQLSALLSVVDK